MPVDRPSMIATVVETVAMLNTAASAVIPVTVIATPMRALRIGSRPATRELNVMSRMKNAMMIPMISGVSVSFGFQSGTLPPSS